MVEGEGEDKVSTMYTFDWIPFIFSTTTTIKCLIAYQARKQETQVLIPT